MIKQVKILTQKIKYRSSRFNTFILRKIGFFSLEQSRLILGIVPSPTLQNYLPGHGSDRARI
jgi:hypothetical protein